MTHLFFWQISWQAITIQHSEKNSEPIKYVYVFVVFHSSNKATYFINSFLKSIFDMSLGSLFFFFTAFKIAQNWPLYICLRIHNFIES